jgi:hypothetical protein
MQVCPGQKKAEERKRQRQQYLDRGVRLDATQEFLAGRPDDSVFRTSREFGSTHAQGTEIASFEQFDKFEEFGVLGKIQDETRPQPTVGVQGLLELALRRFSFSSFGHLQN